MLQFIYKLKISVRVKAKCDRHLRYNPEREGREGVKGECPTCITHFDLHQAKLSLDAAHRDFLRKAEPWTLVRQPRSKSPSVKQE